MNACVEPVRIPYDPGSCGNCGYLISEHNPDGHVQYDPTEQAMWVWYIARGNVRDQFGVNTRTSSLVRAHLEQCAVDINASVAPVTATHDEFIDTFSPTRTINVTIGHITCECVRINDQPWTLEGDITFGDALVQILAGVS